MARVDSGHETVTSEDEEDSITPKHSPISIIDELGSQSLNHNHSSNDLKPFCNECKLSSRRPITCENDLYRDTSCKHENGTPSTVYYSVPQNPNSDRSTSAFEDSASDFQTQNSHWNHHPPPKLTDSLNHDGKAIIRPIAFKPTDIGNRFLITGSLKKNLERHNSENALKRNSQARLSMELTPFSQNFSNGMNAERFGGSLCNVIQSPNQDERDHIKRIGTTTTSLRKFDSSQNLHHPTEWTNTKTTKILSSNNSGGWDSETKRLQVMYEVNIKTAHQRIIKLEQALASNSCQLQQERRKFRAQLDDLLCKNEQYERINGALRNELETIRGQLEEAEWALCHRAGELALLKAQLKDSHGDKATRSHEVVQLKTTLKELATETSNARSKLAQCTLSYRSKERENMILRQSLMQKEKNHKDTMEENLILRRKLKEIDIKHSKDASIWEGEKIKWADEQKKVLRYQKALQHNYIITCQKAQNLALQLESLGMPSHYKTIPFNNNTHSNSTLSLHSTITDQN